MNYALGHASMRKNWGDLRLYKKIDDEAIEEMRHAQLLMDRIPFLVGLSALNAPWRVAAGYHVKDVLEKDLQVETGALRLLQRGIARCLAQADIGHDSRWSISTPLVKSIANG